MAVGHVCVVVMCLLAVEAVVRSGKVYCRDPDTGTLHPVNSTWVSKSFCGHYTCKLRKQNTTATGNTPLREINITNIPELNNLTLDNLNFTIEERSELEIDEVIHKNFVNNITETVEIVPLDINQDLNLRPVGSGVRINKKGNEEHITNQSEDISGEVNKDSDLKQTPYYFHKKTTNTKDIRQNTKNDRLLTKNEIKSISEVLHTMKRSELDAIVDIYNLAQEIYNEISNASTATNTKSEEKGAKSYWYDPYYRGIDMDYQDTSQVIPTYRVSQPKKNLKTFYTGSALSNDDFRRLSYQHFVPSAQNIVPYPIEPTALTPEIPKPCSAKQTTKATLNQNIAEPSYILPYPFAYIQQYNLPRDYPKGLLYNVPYTWDSANSMKKIPPYPGYIGHILGAHNTLLTYPHVQELNQPIKQELLSIEPLEPISTVEPQAKEQELLRRLFVTSNGKLDENMQSKEPSNNILKELKPDPLNFLGPRKKIKFEKVGKMLKLDDMIRRRRSVGKDRRVPDPIVEVEDKNKDDERIIPDPIVEEEDTETYLEKATCQSQLVPGYFRVGNLSEPYPACCPQLITIT